MEPGDERCEECGHRLGPSAPEPPPASAPGARVLIARLGCGMLGLVLALLVLAALIALLVGGLIGTAPLAPTGAWA